MRIRIETERQETIGEATETNRLITDYEFCIEETTSSQTVSEVIDNHIKKHYEYHRAQLYIKELPCVD